MARGILTGGDGVSGQTGAQVIAMINNNFDELYRYDVTEYGAVHDLKTVTDGAMSSGSAVLTSASGLFTPDIVNKRVVVSRAGASGAPLRTTALSYQSPTQITLASANASGGSVSSQMVDWGTDDTVAIQAAINAVFAAKSGEVYFPVGRYMIDGDFQTSISGTNPNCQIYIPSVADSATQLGSITLRGEDAFILPTLRFRVEKTGVILKSTRVGSGTQPSVFGSIGLSGNYLDYNYCDVKMENIAVMVYTNNKAVPTTNGINFRHIATTILKNVSAGIDVGFHDSADPTSVECAGIHIGCRDNNGPNYLETCSATGFKYGFVLGEHTTVNNIYAFASVHGFVIPRQNYLVVGHMLAHYCKNQIYFPESAILGADHDDAKFGRVNLTLEMEDSSTGLWWDVTTFIIDSENVGRGQIKYMFLSGGVIRNDIAIATVTGGVNLDLVPTDGYMTLIATIGSNTNNYAPTNIGLADYMVITPSTSFDLTGIAGVRLVKGRKMRIRNAHASNNITCPHDSASSTAANRFLNPGGTSFVIGPGMTADFEYCTIASRWLKLS
jgi:hypothetical protein